MRGRGQVALVLVVISAALGACGEDEERFGDARIIEKLDLEEVKGQQDYAIDGDLFCSVERDGLLNTRSEVEDAIDEDETSLVVASDEGNVGVVGVPVFADDCSREARKKLNELDPEGED